MIDREMKSSIRHMRKENPDIAETTMICGHSHLLQYDEKLRYANSGWFRRGMAQYVSIQKSGTIRIVDGTY
jgi:hypothetical protein